MSRLVPIFFDGEHAAEEVRHILEPAGFIVRAEGGRLVAMRVPKFLRNVPEIVAKPKAKKSKR